MQTASNTTTVNRNSHRPIVYLL